MHCRLFRYRWQGGLKAMLRKVRFYVFLIIIIVLLTGPGVAGNVPGGSFDLLPLPHWAYNDLALLSEAHLLEGYTDRSELTETFPLTRYEIAMLVGGVLENVRNTYVGSVSNYLLQAGQDWGPEDHYELRDRLTQPAAEILMWQILDNSSPSGKRVQLNAKSVARARTYSEASVAALKRLAKEFAPELEVLGIVGGSQLLATSNNLKELTAWWQATVDGESFRLLSVGDGTRLADEVRFPANKEASDANKVVGVLGVTHLQAGPLQEKGHLNGFTLNDALYPVVSGATMSSLQRISFAAKRLGGLALLIDRNDLENSQELTRTVLQIDWDNAGRPLLAGEKGSVGHEPAHELLATSTGSQPVELNKLAERWASSLAGWDERKNEVALTDPLSGPPNSGEDSEISPRLKLEPQINPKRLPAGLLSAYFLEQLSR